jgi:hypothetical protein
MREENLDPREAIQPEVDEMTLLVANLRITAECQQIEVRPDVSVEEQELWKRQDPEYPPEHYRCVLKMGDRQMELYQTVGADYPDEEAVGGEDLYSEVRSLLLSPEFLLESAGLKAFSIDAAGNLEEWIDNAYVETTTPKETYEGYIQLRQQLFDFLGSDNYETVVEYASETEFDTDEESEE